MDVLRLKSLGTRTTSGGRYVLVPNEAALIVGDVPAHRRLVVTRRRQTFIRMLAVVAVLAIAALFIRGWAFVLFALSVLALGAYVALLLKWKSQTQQAADVVRHLPAAEPYREDAELVRVAAGGIYADRRIPHDDAPLWEPQAGVRIRRWDDE